MSETKQTWVPSPGMWVTYPASSWTACIIGKTILESWIIQDSDQITIFSDDYILKNFRPATPYEIPKSHRPKDWSCVTTPKGRVAEVRRSQSERWYETGQGGFLQDARNGHMKESYFSYTNYPRNADPIPPKHLVKLDEFIDMRAKPDKIADLIAVLTSLQLKICTERIELEHETFTFIKSHADKLLEWEDQINVALKKAGAK